MYAPPRYPPFFLSDHASPGALHSSPTRRSSDLAGRLAQTKATNAEVKKFAERMIADHEGVNKQAIALATKLKVTPQDNDTSKSLKAGGDKNVATLKTLSGAAFDKAYVDQEVAYHQA